MNEVLPPDAPPLPPRRRRRKWLILGGLAALFLALLPGMYIYLLVVSSQRLQEAIAETDRLDPGWRIEEIEAKRQQVPDGENSALVAIAARQQMPKRWPPPPEEPVLPEPVDPPPDPAGMPPMEFPEDDFYPKPLELSDHIHRTPSPVQLYEALTEELRAELDKVAPALAEARKLKDLPYGRYPLTYAPDYISTIINSQQEARTLALMLRCDAAVLAQEEKIDDALASGRAGLNVARSLGDEPFSISQLIRISCTASAIAGVERTLAQGQASDEAMKAVQELLALEAEVPIFLVITRGERGVTHGLLEAIESGKASGGVMGGPPGPPGVRSIRDRVEAVQFKAWHPALLRYLNRAVEIARLPIEERDPPLQKLDAEIAKDGSPLIKLLMPALSKMNNADQRTKALLRCSIAAVAAERYRRKQGRWPESLETLVQAKLLPAVLVDPYDSKPLRLRCLPDGIFIYSPGPDKKDDGGIYDPPNVPYPGVDIGFRLWNVDQRRQPPVEMLHTPREDFGNGPQPGDLP